MIPVEQTILGGDTTVIAQEERGNCLAACFASIFELAIDDVPNFVVFDDWHGEMCAWVEARGFRLGSPFVRVREDDPTRLNGHPSDGQYWIGSVLSPRLIRDDGTPGLHAVVMNGGEIAWDPHPRRYMGHLGFTGLGWTFIAPDPARLVLR